MIICPHCESDDIALQESTALESPVTATYKFKVFMCFFFCHQCGYEFQYDLDEEERKEYL